MPETYFSFCSTILWSRYFTTHVGAMIEIVFLLSKILSSRCTPEVLSFFAKQSALIDNFYSTGWCKLPETYFSFCSTILWSRYMPDMQGHFAKESSLLGSDWLFYSTCRCNAWNIILFFLCSTILWQRYLPEVLSFFAKESSLLSINWSFYSTCRCNAWNIFFKMINHRYQTLRDFSLKQVKCISERNELLATFSCRG